MDFNGKWKTIIKNKKGGYLQDPGIERVLKLDTESMNY